jgi:hypothetical protein
MMNPVKQKKEEGEKILNNYKKQIAEKMAREKAERGEGLSSSASNRGKKKIDDEEEDEDNFGNRAADIGVNEPPEPEVLLSILHRRSKK